MEHLYLVVFGTGLLTTLFDAAFRAYLPGLVGKERLVESNRRLALSESVAEVTMPGLTGVLVQVVSAPLTMLFDAVSYLFSAAFLLRIRSPEAAPGARQLEEGLRSSLKTMALEVSEGLGVLGRDPRLWAVLGGTSTRDFFGGFFAALYTLYAVRYLGFGPAAFGVLISAGGAGALLGAMASAQPSRRAGVGTLLVGSMLLSGRSGLLILLAASWRSAALGLMLAYQLVGDFFRVI